VEPLTTVFFYGGIINPVVMKRLGLKPRSQALAILPGYDITFAPLVNLVRSPMGVAFGLLAELPQSELTHAYSLLKVTYDPEPVLTFDASRQIRPALCYIAHGMPLAPPDREQVSNLLAGAVALGIPGWYLDKIRGFGA
jgi:hypothetical protein